MLDVTSLLVFYVSMNIYFYFYLNIARSDVITVLFMFVDIYHLHL